MDIMYMKGSQKPLEVYGFDVEHGTALCFDPSIPASNKGSGWLKIQTKQLIPEKYVNKTDATFMSQTERNQIKRQLRIVNATWECTDGQTYDHEHIEQAIAHQREITKG